MPLTTRNQIQAYNDGLISIYRITNTAEPGEMPNHNPVLQNDGINYANRIVGMSRFWMGMQSNARIDRMIRIPRGPIVHPLDIVETEDGDRYEIKQIQYPPDVIPLSIDLSLQLIKTREDLDPAPEADPDEGGGDP